MLEAVIIVASGLFIVSIITHYFGYRLGGTITLPILALFTLKTLWLFPVFVLSGLLAYIALDIARKNTLIYGRHELLLALFFGSVPVVTLLFVLLVLFPTAQDIVSRLAFIGGIVPGLAAYNFHQIQPEYRWKELTLSTLVTAGLIALGALLVSPQTTILTEYTPSILFSQTSDIAHLRNAVVRRNVPPEIAARPLVVLLLGVGVGISELIRARLGFHIGILTVGLIALFTVSSRRLLFLFLFITPLCFGLITICHRYLLLYGRVLIGIGSGVGVLLVPGVLQLFGSARGLSALFVGLIAGITAYNLHTTAPAERRQSVALMVAVYALSLLLIRLFVQPFRRGFPQELGVMQVGGLGLLAAIGIAAFFQSYIFLPSDDAVFSASVLSGGDE